MVTIFPAQEFGRVFVVQNLFFLRIDIQDATDARGDIAEVTQRR